MQITYTDDNVQFFPSDDREYKRLLKRNPHPRSVVNSSDGGMVVFYDLEDCRSFDLLLKPTSPLT